MNSPNPHVYDFYLQHFQFAIRKLPLRYRPPSWDHFHGDCRCWGAVTGKTGAGSARPPSEIQVSRSFVLIRAPNGKKPESIWPTNAQHRLPPQILSLSRSPKVRYAARDAHRSTILRPGLSRTIGQNGFRSQRRKLMYSRAISVICSTNCSALMVQAGLESRKHLRAASVFTQTAHHTGDQHRGAALRSVGN